MFWKHVEDSTLVEGDKGKYVDLIPIFRKAYPPAAPVVALPSMGPAIFVEKISPFAVLKYGPLAHFDLNAPWDSDLSNQVVAKSF